jgi:2-keto-4-pentenoate hydratase/2-oxohepta-3-ene-1,7-dioic acid hydratase in catechol pathway
MRTTRPNPVFRSPEPVVSEGDQLHPGPNDPVMLPRASIKTDWEVELAS